MQRTNIYLPVDLQKKLQNLASADSQSVAQLVREFVAEGVQKRMKKKETSVLLTMAANAKSSGKKDIGKNHDKYLYGTVS